MRVVRSYLGVAGGLMTAAALSFLANCSASETDSAEEAIGAANSLGLSLRYDDETSTVQASLKDALKPGEKLYIRVRQGKILFDSQEKLDCSDLQKASAFTRKTSEGNEVVYQGPVVSPNIIKLVSLFNDERWARGTVPDDMLAQRAAGADPIVEACIVRPGKAPVRLVTNLAYAWDLGVRAAKEIRAQRSRGLRLLDGDDAGFLDGGEPETDAGADAGPEPLTEGRSYSQIQFAQLCVNELGEIPFFPKLAGKQNSFETFDCRDLVANGPDGRTTHSIEGVEGSRIPAMVNDVEVEKCSPGSELGLNDESYSCLDKADRGMFLASLGTQPGPMVVTAKNSKGSHWVLLCRKVSDDGNGMMKTKVFNDIAMIGTNPATGRTCFFQNAIGAGVDGAHVTHPGDVDKSTAVWSPSVQEYCSRSCHGADAFVHSPWLDGAKRAGGHDPIVPKMGVHPDFLVSDNEHPYSIINGEAQGFHIPPQLVSEEVEVCTTCHRLAGSSMLGDFSQWSTGQGSEYASLITDEYQKFEKSHTMPIRLTGLTKDNFADSEWGKAVKVANECSNRETDNEKCKFAKIPSKR